ncbi:uncharacterized protein At5g01610 [Aegilops tauschii subsp. strangulata]|uniref:DUF538 family protein n=1 Tax=Aegilops tauschii subsp. strangulata TaxID=200361 RepID=A0A453IA14_AEGTS|nr:uncharacterized protein At5g01610 [Aegilops tauschii subsp. strangulata]
MDEIMNKMGSYWLGQRANKEMSSAGDDIESLSTSVGDGAKWLVNKLKGKMQKPLAELLQEHDLPAGLFPREATNYEFEPETRRLTVHIPAVCEVGYRDGSELRFDTTVAGTLDKGSLTGVEGLKAKVLVWARVTAVKADAAKVYFAVGIKKSRSREAYEVIRGAITVDEF